MKMFNNSLIVLKAAGIFKLIFNWCKSLESNVDRFLKAAGTCTLFIGKFSNLVDFAIPFILSIVAFRNSFVTALEAFRIIYKISQPFQMQFKNKY
jgi:hypothetical protein